MAGDASGGVLELKFRLHPEVVAPVTDWMRATLQPDPHGTGEHGDGYLVQSIYLDTPSLDVFHRRGSFGRAKFRIRRYGEGQAVFLERKLKRLGVVRKRRVPVSPAALEHLKIEANGAVWPGRWFQDRLAVRGLRPVVRMSYRRIARLGGEPDSRFRVTLDREVRATAADGFTVPCPLEGEDLLRGGAVFEVKFSSLLPTVVKGLVDGLGLKLGALSKYRLGVRACGLVADAEKEIGEESDSSHV